ncbi:hypothetical protein cypCar_00041254 [Cyprinus carpio]|nr:hypothetical protein cypCar_00041254 [Cyprinus carpio]
MYCIHFCLLLFLLLSAALSDRGTVVMEAALSRALSAVDTAVSDRNKAEAGCRGCVPCLFQDCGQRKGACASPEDTQSEPSCQVISRAQEEVDEGERSWLLSQACGFYKRRCTPAQVNKDLCVRVMGESCSARVLQCSLLNTMQNLEPATKTTAQDGPSADVVMEAKVPLLSQTTCRSSLGKELLTNTMFCAGYLSGGIDSCQGDSGGPLIYQDGLSGRFQLFGITSWGDGCGERGKPGVYTRVTAFSDWVMTEIQKSFGSREPTCPELLKTSELSEEQQMSEFTTLCHFYTLSCSSTLDPSACQRLAQDKCQSRFKKCQ